jgi:plasmid stabilization system protein ParE
VKAIEFDLDAKGEMMEASQFYEARGIGLGVSFLSEVQRAIQLVSSFPESGSPLTANVRRTLVKRFPYAIIYSNQPEKIFIVAVMHTSRKPGYWRKRL